MDHVQNRTARHHNRCIDLEHDAARIAGTEKPHLFHSISGYRVTVNLLSSRVALFTALRIRREDTARHLASVEPEER